MKIVKASILIAVTAFVALFSYANLRVLSLGERQKPVAHTSFVFQEEIGSQKLSALESSFKSTAGVTACTINGSSKTACLIYHQDMVNESQIVDKFITAGIKHVEKKDLAASGKGCPVHAVNASISRMITSLDLRSH